MRLQIAVLCVAVAVLAAIPASSQVYNPPTLPGMGSATADLVHTFGATCDGTTDDAAAFSAAVTWLSGAANRLVTIPAATCATSTTVTLGNGREQSTTTNGALVGGETTIAVTSCSGINSGDRAVLILDSGTAQRLAITSSCSAGSMTVSPAVSGAAASGNVIYTGANSTYNGGGFVGYGSGGVPSELGPLRDVSTIKYIGSGAPTTTLSGTANAADLTISVASNASITLETPIGITLDNGRVWWTKPTRTPSSTTINIANEIPSTATSGNTVTIASNPVAKIQGPILNPVLQGIKLDANNLAAIGLEAVHPMLGKFQGPGGITAANYTAMGFFVPSQVAYLGTASGAFGNDFEFYAVAPQNNKTLGAWVRGGWETTVCVCQNRFWGGIYTMGGNDVTAAGLRMEYADNNTFIKPYSAVNGASTSGAGLFRQMPVNKGGLGSNAYINPAFLGNVTDNNATGGSLRYDTIVGYATGDGETAPTGKETGFTDVGVGFGAQIANTYTVSPTTPTGTASATAVMMGLAGSFTPVRSGTVMISLSGNIRNNTASDGANFTIRTGTGSAPANNDALTGTLCGNAGGYLMANNANTANTWMPFNNTCLATGLVVGTTYWIDAALKAVTGGTATINTPQIVAIEQ